MDNHIYNLMLQLTQEHKSLWRIQNEYLKDAESCEACQKIWNDLAKQKEENAKTLENHLTEHMHG